MLSMDRWRGKTALVTGASSGMGEAIARRLAAEGMRVGLAARRDERLRVVQGKIEQGGGQALAIPTDLRDEESLMAMFVALRTAWGEVDVLVNNAGLGWENSMEEGRTADWREMADVNVMALAICMREALKDMDGKEHAQIVNVSSSTAHGVPPGKNLTFYAATKFAVRGLTDGMRAELLEKGSKVRIGMVTPGLTETGFHVRFFRDEAKAAANYAQFKTLEAEDVADAVWYLLATPPHVQISDLIFRPLGQYY